MHSGSNGSLMKVESNADYAPRDYASLIGAFFNTFDLALRLYNFFQAQLN